MVPSVRELDTHKVYTKINYIFEVFLKWDSIRVDVLTLGIHCNY